ncbi:MAG: stage V sporulation protein AD [Limnochordales bacterium]|nr:stage V sporulation protein AD [Bacillota bacterium]REJ33545.1 MAG: stage V sporulation protein AD [Bacillota bacterium]
MTAKRVGQFTVQFSQPPRIVGAFTLMGPREGQGPLGKYFDAIVDDYMWGEYQPEKAERKFLEHAARRALERAGVSENDVDYFIAGDLMNQIVSSTFSARSLGIPHIGVFAACATSTLGLSLAAMLVDGGFARRVLVATASHYQTAERQYRYPIELNIQRKPTNQWTATGGAAAVVAAEGEGPRISHVTVGRVMDWGVKDANHMGAAMAPAAMDTLLRHFQDTNTTPADFDLILTGDLAQHGSKLFRELVKREGHTLGGKHMDAGASLYSPEQQPGAGASGAVCSASVLLAYVLKEMAKGRYRRVLALATGCLHNALTTQQGDSCPGVCHALVLENG